MLIPNHPHDERLSALASGDPEAVADSTLSEHVASCIRCTDTVAELAALRASLAELPDLLPQRPLRLVPPVADESHSRADRVGGWARRFFAPVLTAGAALAMVGLVGTTAPLIGGMASQAAPGGDSAEMDIQQEPATTDGRLSAGSEAPDAPAAAEATDQAKGAGENLGGYFATDPSDVARPLDVDDGASEASGGDAEQEREALVEERSIWPMLLFTGVAVMIAAALLRWILAPRSG
jgi:anti-sigma factor RsiW